MIRTVVHNPMLGFWFGFVLGIIVLPTLYALIPGFFGISKAKTFPASGRRKNLPISNKLKNEIKKSLVPTCDLGWINVILHRFYFDTVRSYYFEHKIKQSIMKNFESVIGTGLLKNVKITGIHFGAEAPYLKSIRLITLEEYKRISATGKSDTSLCNDTISTHLKCGIAPVRKKTINFASMSNLNKFHNDERLFESEGAVGSKDSKNILETVSLNDQNVEYENDILSSCPDSSICQKTESSGMDTTEHKKDIMSACPDNNISEKNISSHEESKRHIEFESIMEETEIQEIYRNATFFGEISYDGAFQMMIEVELPRGIHVNSTITLKGLHSDILFKIPAENYTTRYEMCLINTPNIDIEVISGLVTDDKKLYFQNSISSLLKRTAISSFKSTFQYPSWLQIVHPMVPSSKLPDFKPKKITTQNLHEAIPEFDKILLMTSCDLRIIEVKNRITMRKSYNTLNCLDYVYSWSFQLPKKSALAHKNEFAFFEGLNSSESATMHAFETLDILKHIILGITDTEIIQKYRNVALMRIRLNTKKVEAEESIEMIRMIYKNNVVFFRNDMRLPEFLLFKICDGDLHIFSFTLKSSKLYLSSKQIKLIKKVLEEGVCGSRANAFDEEQSTEIESNSLEIERLLRIALDPGTSPFKKFSVTLKVGIMTGKEYLLDGNLRAKAFGDTCKIVSLHRESDNIQTTIIENISLESNQKESIRVHTFFNKKFIVDCCPETGTVFVYSFRKYKKASTCVMNILYRSGLPVVFPNFFIESMKIKASLQRYFDDKEFQKSEENVIVESYVKKGSIFLEFKTGFEDDYSLEIFSCKRQCVLFDIYKIITQKPFTVIYPVENDYIRVTLAPKNRRNAFVEYKFRNFQNYNDVLVRGLIGLNTNQKVRVKIMGAPTHVIFWEWDPEIQLKGYIQDSERKNEISSCGMLRSEAREYVLAFKNKKGKLRNIEVFAGITELC